MGPRWIDNCGDLDAGLEPPAGRTVEGLNGECGFACQYRRRQTVYGIVAVSSATARGGNFGVKGSNPRRIDDSISRFTLGE